MNLSKIKEAYANRDLEALDAMAIPVYRELNKKNDFRSALMLSCNNVDHLSKIESLDAECVILNLEDGVAKEDKPFALVLCAIFISSVRKSDKKLVVRVNAIDEGGYEEITYLNQFMPDAIRVSKIKNEVEVRSVLHLIKDDIELHLSVETALAWKNLSSLAVNRKVTAFYLGALDLFADMGLPHSLINLENPTMKYILSHFLVTSLSVGVKPVSFVFQDYKNMDAFSGWLELEKSMGYSAKGCVSPSQAALVNKTFVDEVKEIQRAQIIVKLFEMRAEEGVTGFVDEEYGFIDEPIYKGALNMLKR
jgi:citrate lyase subunit beta / citryl-CoA lyase